MKNEDALCNIFSKNYEVLDIGTGYKGKNKYLHV
jgi:hypothetical protein